MLSIYTIPKAFTQDEHIRIIQTNAIRSWQELPLEKEIILLGREDGIREYAHATGCRYDDGLEYSHTSDIYVRSIIERGEACSTHHFKLFINADIILLPECAHLITEMCRKYSNMLIVGRRIDWDIEGSIDFSPGWDSKLKQRVVHEGQLHSPCGKDYFLYDGALCGGRVIPSFLLGYFYWDDWLLGQAITHKRTVIDATNVLYAIHQNHAWIRNRIHMSRTELKSTLGYRHNTRAAETYPGEYIVGASITNCPYFFTQDHTVESRPRKEVIFQGKRVCQYGFDYIAQKIKKLLPVFHEQEARILLYGAGEHTQALLTHTELAQANIIGICDRNSECETFGYPFIPLNEIQNAGADVIIISSRHYQEEIAAQLESLPEQPFKIVRLYPLTPSYKAVSLP